LLELSFWGLGLLLSFFYYSPCYHLAAWHACYAGLCYAFW